MIINLVWILQVWRRTLTNGTLWLMDKMKTSFQELMSPCFSRPSELPHAAETSLWLSGRQLHGSTWCTGLGGTVPKCEARASWLFRISFWCINRSKIISTSPAGRICFSRQRKCSQWTSVCFMRPECCVRAVEHFLFSLLVKSSLLSAISSRRSFNHFPLWVYIKPAEMIMLFHKYCTYLWIYMSFPADVSSTMIAVLLCDEACNENHIQPTGSALKTPDFS